MEQDMCKILLTEEQIQERIKELAEVLSAEYAGKNPIFVGVLKGVFMFFGDMLKRITVPCEVDFMWVSSYRGTESSFMEVKKDVATNLKGRHVVILEDIFDTGNTLNYTVSHLLRKEPASVKICTLLDKPSRRSPDVTLEADYIGFTVPNEFVVGYGLDFDECYRNLPYIGILKPEVYQK